MSKTISEFKKWHEDEYARLWSVFLAAQDANLSSPTADSERRVREVHGALLKHMALEDIELPPGWAAVR